MLVVAAAAISNNIIIVTLRDRKSTRLNSSHANISYAVFCLKKKNQQSPKDDTHAPRSVLPHTRGGSRRRRHGAPTRRRRLVRVYYGHIPRTTLPRDSPYSLS